MVVSRPTVEPVPVPIFVLVHEHSPAECRHAFAAWYGFDSPLRHSPALGACLLGEHRLFWTVRATDNHTALEMLPDFVAQRTDALEVRATLIP